MSSHERHLQQVIVVPYDPLWPSLYEQAAAELARALGSNIIAIHHIGSTAIPEIHAKPIIDLMPVVRALAAVDERADAIQHLGYEPLGELGIAGRRFLRRFNAAGQRTHHVHVFSEGSPHVQRHLAFRDYLHAHPTPAQQYSELKQRLAAAHPDNWNAYCDGKDEFVGPLEIAALNWYVTSGGS
jgi:GrpB-like predicted nucleotidyltransferase (UPF0157 family)